MDFIFHKAVCIFCMYIVWLEILVWARLYKTVHLCTHDQLFELQCTVQILALPTIQRGTSRLPAHILLLELRVLGKIWKFFTYMVLPSEAQPCDFVLYEVRVKTTEIA